MLCKIYFCYILLVGKLVRWTNSKITSCSKLFLFFLDDVFRTWLSNLVVCNSKRVCSLLRFPRYVYVYQLNMAIKSRLAAKCDQAYITASLSKELLNGIIYCGLRIVWLLTLTSVTVTYVFTTTYCTNICIQSTFLSVSSSGERLAVVRHSCNLWTSQLRAA